MNDVEVLKKEYLKGKIIHLSDLMSVSEGSPKVWMKYVAEQLRTIDQLLTLIHNKIEPKKSIKVKIINWIINNLKKLL